MASKMITKCVILLLCTFSVVKSASQIGCYREERRQRYFADSPGDYDPATVTPNICASKCGAFQFSYAGLTSGKYCFCANNLPPISRKGTAGDCDLTCPGDNTASCGSLSHVDIYLTTTAVSGLSLTSTAAGSVVETATAVTFQIETVTGSNLVFKMDYDDGAGPTADNATDMDTKVFYMPGEYSVTVTATDVGNTLTPTETAAGVLVQDGVAGVVVTCPSGLATFEEGECHVTLDRGNDLELTDFIDGTQNKQFTIADPPVSGTGIGVQAKGTQTVTGSGNGVYTIPSAEFKYKGKVTGWELWATVAGTIKIAILQPDCGTGDYCYTTNQCATCGGVSCPSDVFCPRAKTCQSSCGGINRYPALNALNNYKVRQVVTVTITATGYNYIPETVEVLVEPGDILAYERTASSGVLTMQSMQTTNDFLFSGTLTLASTFAFAAGNAETSKIHHLRAIYTGQSATMLTYTFTNPGNFTIMVNVTNTKLSHYETAETTVMVVEGINITEIVSEPYAATNEAVVFNIQPQTGTNIQYDWDFGDGVVLNNTDNSTGVHVYTAAGNYTVTVCSWNVVSRKCNTTTVTVQDRLAGLQVTSSPSLVAVNNPFSFALTSGTDYTCVWDFGDGGATETTTPAQTPVGSGTVYIHVYSTGGNFTVNVTCSNDVNTESADMIHSVQEMITNLRLLNSGAAKNSPFTVVWFIDTGTDVEFSLFLDGASLAIATANTAAKRWESVTHAAMPVGRYELQLNASNLISAESVNIMFTVEVAMKDVTVVSTNLRVGTLASVIFTVDMTEGSNVVVLWSWDDGSANETLDIGATDWASRPPEVRSHAFVNAGTYNVLIVVSNSANTIVRNFAVVAIQSVNGVRMETNEFVTYAPPGITTFTFRTSGTAPNEATVEFDFDDPADDDKYVYNLTIDFPYRYEYRDRFQYNMTAVLKNDISTKTFERSIIVVEPIVNMRIVTEPDSAVKDEPLTVKIIMYRGPSNDRCNLSIDFGDGSPILTQPRTGFGKDGTDVLTVTYTALTPRTISVTATTPMETATATKVVSVELKVETPIIVTTNHPVTFPNAIQYSVTYPAAPLPTNAQIKINYGDGTTPFVGIFDSTTFPEAAGGTGGIHVWTYTPTSDGHFTATITIWNGASSFTTQVLAGVYKSITGVDFVPTFQPLLPIGGPIKNGLDGLNTKFPRDRDVIFTVSVTQGTAVTYELTSTGPGGGLACTKLSSPFECSFKNVSSGVHDVSIKVSNPISSQTKLKQITLVDSVVNMVITELANLTKVDDTKLLKFQYDMEGTGSCLHLDWGDGTKETYGTNCDPAFGGNPVGALTNPLTTPHVYTSPGFKTVTATTSNSHSSERGVITFSISNTECTKPYVTIEDRAIYFYNPTSFIKSKQFVLRGLSNILCGVTYDNTKLWTLERIDEAMGTVVGSVDLGALGITDDLAELTVPPKKLAYGLYKATYTMEMQPEVGDGARYLSQSYSYLKVDKSPIVAMMVKGGVSAVKKSIEQTVLLDPQAYSFDPDIDRTLPQGLSTFTWSCEVLTSTSLTCPAGLVPTSTTASSTTVDTTFLVVDNDYSIKVVITKNDPDGVRTATSSLRIKVVAPPASGAIPSVGIGCAGSSRCFPGSEDITVPSTARLGLKCACLDCSPTDNLEFRWKAYAYDYVWQWPWKPFIKRDFEKYVIGTFGIKSEQISIQPDLFAIQPEVKQYVFECNIRKVGDAEWGAVYTQIKLNEPPVPGTCTVTPLTGTVTWGQDKPFTISCNGWQDEQNIIEYKYYIMHKDNYMEYQLTKTNKPGDIHVDLPLGSPYDDYNEDIFVKVMDSLEAVTTFKIARIKVTPMNRPEIKFLTERDIEDKMSELDRIKAEGIQRIVTEIYSDIGSILNSESRLVQTEYKGILVGANLEPSLLGIDGEKRSGAFELGEYDEAMRQKALREADARAQIRAAAIEGCANVSTSDVSAMEQVSTCISSNAQFSSECTKACLIGFLLSMQEMGSEKGLEMAQQLLNMDISFEQLKTASLAIMDVITCTSNAAAFNMKHAILSEYLEDQSKPEFFILDTNLDNEDYPINAWTLEEAEFQQTMLVHARYQREVAKNIEIKRSQTMKIVNTIWAKTLIPGESHVQKTTTIVASFTNVHVSSMAGMTFAAHAKATTNASSPEVKTGATMAFPGSFSDMFTGGQVGPEDSIAVAISKTNNHAGRFAESSKLLGETTSFVSISVLNTNTGLEIPVTNTLLPFDIFIPRDINTPRLDFTTNNPLVGPDNDFFVHRTEIREKKSSVHIEFDLGDKNVQLLVAVKFGKFPFQGPGGCDFVGTIPKVVAGGDPNDKFRYSYYLTDEQVNDFTGKVYIGVRQLKPEDQDRNFTDCDSIPALDPKDDSDKKFTTSYKTRIYVTGCYFFDEATEQWDTKGCHVGPRTDVDRTHCLCTHLTTFAGGWVVPPNTIDWDFVFSNADFYQNPTIYITMIIIIVVYLMVAIWARRKDRKDIEKLGITPLKDNDPRDKYYYEIIVTTGMRRNAATHSKVCLILSGEYDETDVRLLNDEKRKVFERGSTNTFLMAVPKPIGGLNYARIWHDNSGKGNMGSWFMKYMLVRDVQTNEKYIFIADKWFAVEEGDGQVDRVIPVAGKEQMTNFSYLFSQRSRKNLVDGHLWFSVLARPPQSRFTRLQRVSCCLCLLFTTMVANAMFYGIPTDSDGGQQTFTFGPFALSPTQIYIGVVCNLIVFPINFIVITLFRKSRARKLRPSRINEALKNIPLTKSKTSASMTDVQPEVASIFQISRPSTVTGDPKRPETATSRPGTSMSTAGGLKSVTDKKKKKCELPWWFRYVGWALLWLTTLVSGAFVIFYAIMFGDEKTKKWITSLLISFITSVFFTQPIKVFLTAIFLSLIIKNPGEEEEEQPEDEEEPQLNTDEEFLHAGETGYGATRPRKIGYKPPDPKELEKAREKRLNEIKMWKIIREIVFYSFFLWILMVISYRNRTPDSYLYKENMERMFIKNNETNIWFTRVQNTKDFWKWARSGLINGIRASNYYNNYPPFLLRGFVNDKVSRIMGYATMRQLRVKPALCKPSKVLRTVIDECNSIYSIFSEDKRSFLPGWKDIPPNTAVNDTDMGEYGYKSASELNGYPYWGILELYGGGGYIYALRQNKSTMTDKMLQLEEEGWIDKYTRAVFIEFTVYNAQVNLFGVATILCEFQPSGGVVQSYRFEPAMLIPYMSSVVLFQIICEIVYLIFTMAFIVIEIRNFYKQRMQYFKYFWNWIELSIIGSSVGSVVVYFYRLIVVNRLTSEIKEFHGNSYMKFQYAAYWSEMFSYMIGWLVFSATLKFLKLLRFNKRVSLLAGTLKHGARGIIHFSLIFWIVFFAFSQLFYLTFMSSHHSFYSFVSSVEALITMMMGKFDIYGMLMVQPVLTQVYMFFFVLTVTFILVNMFMSILNETFTAVRSDISKRNNDYEIVNFMIGRFKKWTGIGSTAPTMTPEELSKQKGQQYKKKPSVADFPDRIERLLTSISSVYLDQDPIGPLDTKMDMRNAVRGQYSDVRKTAKK
ncbi:uncharacterized protein LOC121379844 [Gigantopelta aegis]|uniref:uncharacterized protein LOC121379844 n=1 Tax=Gigantopelta aegis TaxID=1735272 RepID=UPI001B88C051|nr:uncharacterized protein LOC121379844 [Gigantopelta aegis]